MVDWKKIRDKGQEIVLEKAQIPLAAYRHKHFPSLITALEEREARIEFLEKALEQAVDCGQLAIEKGHKPKWDAIARDSDDAALHCEYCDAVPELAKYLEEKNV